LTCCFSLYYVKDYQLLFQFSLLLLLQKKEIYGKVFVFQKKQLLCSFYFVCSKQHDVL